nr:OmpA family protein [Burkholderia sp. AU19243]
MGPRGARPSAGVVARSAGHQSFRTPSRRHRGRQRRVDRRYRPTRVDASARQHVRARRCGGGAVGRVHRGGRRQGNSSVGPDSNLLVTGYTDSVKAGPARPGFNQALSEARARQVAQILVAAGVPAQHIGVVGKSDADPLADNGTPDGRARNRRVEVTVSD